MPKINIAAPKGYHWMQYEGGPVLMVGDYAPHEGAAESIAVELIEEHDPDRLPEDSVDKYGTPDPEFAQHDPLKKGEEWDKIYNAILERTGDKELAAATATARAGSRFEKAPAEPHERRRGSAVNPEGSAGGARGGIKLSEANIKALETKRDEHNEKVGDAKTKRADLGMLKAVFRRGAGAFSTSHRPSVQSRDQWAMARVNAFLKLLSSGRPANPKYRTDFDLLPKGHPKSTKKADATALLKESFKPPEGVQEEAARGLEMRREHGRGGTEIGVARARNLSNGDGIPLETINRMVSYFARHEVDLKAPKNRDRSAPGYPGSGLIAWKLWGGDAGKTWANSIAEREAKKEQEVEKASKEYLEAALELAKDKIPGWAYAKIHQAARSKAGGKRKYSKGSDKAIALMAIAQMQPDTLAELNNSDLKVVFQHLLSWFKEHSRDDAVREGAVRAAMYSTEEMSKRGMKFAASELVRESKALYEKRQAQLKRLNKSSVPVHNPDSPFVFVVEEPNEVDVARGTYLAGQDGRIFNDMYLKPLNLRKSDICVVDVSQLEWLENQQPREVIALGRVAKQALGDLATCSLPHPKAVRRFGDSGEVSRKIKTVLKRNANKSLDATFSPDGYSKTEEDIGSNPDELIEKQDRSSQVLPGESEALSMVVPIAKADQEKQIVYGVVLDPYQIDSQDDWVPPRAIEETAHRWLAESRVIGLDHSEETSASPVESYMVPYPTRADYQKAMDGEPHRAYTMPFGDDVVHSGSWVLGTKLGDAEWAKVKAGELNAYSIGGYGNRQETTKASMPEVEFIELKEEL